MLDFVSSCRQQVNDVYDKVISGRLGRTTSKEQYGFLFRKSKLQVSGTYQYPDPGDIFEREPFTVRFRALHAAVDDFAIAAIHTSPNHAKDEIGNLTKVYDAIRQNWHIENIIIMGDFNMDCSYVSKAEIQMSPLHTDTRFMWLIGENVDTTVRDTTDCTYDRSVNAENFDDVSISSFFVERRFDISFNNCLDESAGDGVGDGVDDCVGDGVDDSVDDCVGDGVHDYVGDGVDDCVGDGVDNCVGDSVDDCVGDGVNDCVGDSVYDCVGDGVNDCVGDSVDDCVGDSVDDCVGDSVDDCVGDGVDDCVGDGVDGNIQTAG
ncbi:hypothetical protein CHS0354_034671, partial [Potamilus streckersoni]